MTTFIFIVLLFSQPDPGDEFRWPNNQWFRQEASNWASNEVAAYPFLKSTIFVKGDAKVTLNAAGAYVDAIVFSEEYGIFFTAKIWISLPRYPEWQSSSPNN